LRAQRVGQLSADTATLYLPIELAGFVVSRPLSGDECGAGVQRGPGVVGSQR